MNVLFVSNNLRQGGKERQILFLLQFLNQGGITTALLLRKNEVSFDLSKIKETIIYFSESANYYHFIKTYIKTILLFKPDIIHTWEGMVTSLGIAVNLLFNKKLINGEIRYSHKVSKFSSERLQQIFNTTFSDINIANTKSGLKSFKLSENYRNIVIPNGYDLNSLPLYPAKEEKSDNFITICKVANFTQPKDYFTLVSVCSELLREGYKLHCKFIGAGPELELVKNTISDQYFDKFKFLGKRDDVFDQLYSSDICILLSKKGHSEGMSNAIMEYMLAGKPVIVTNTGGNSDLIIDGVNGYLIEHENRIALKNKLINLIENTDLRSKMGKKSKESALNNFDMRNVSSTYIRVYNKLVPNNGRISTN